MNQFHVGKAGGGNVGFALSAFTELDLSLSTQDEIRDVDNTDWQDERRLILIHVMDEWRAAMGSDDRYRIVVHRVNPAHVGLAASAALQLAAWCGLGVLQGPITSEDLRGRIASSYRESVNGTLVAGFTTGLSSFLGLVGGFAVVNPDLTPRSHIRVPDWTAAVVVEQSTTGIGFGEAEIRTLTGRASQLDAVVRLEKDRIVNEVLIPAVATADIRAVGQAIYHLQSIGSKVAEIDLYGERIRRTVLTLQSEFEVVFMSAVGPGIAVLSEASEVEMAARLARCAVQVVWYGHVDNCGLTINGHPRHHDECAS